MPRIGIELNNVCNLDCTHCFRSIYRGGAENNKDFFCRPNCWKKSCRSQTARVQPRRHHRRRTANASAFWRMPGHHRANMVSTFHFLTNARNFQKTLKAISVRSRKAQAFRHLVQPGRRNRSNARQDSRQRFIQRSCHCRRHLPRRRDRAFADHHDQPGQSPRN
jgi:hypothetical protein